MWLVGVRLGRTSRFVREIAPNDIRFGVADMRLTTMLRRWMSVGVVPFPVLSLRTSRELALARLALMSGYWGSEPTDEFFGLTIDPIDEVVRTVGCVSQLSQSSAAKGAIAPASSAREAAPVLSQEGKVLELVRR